MTNPPAPRFPDGDYEIEGLLGSGAMAVVYRARDLRRSRDVAMKVLRPELTPVIGAERFRREIAVVSRLSHPHIVPLLDTGQIEMDDGSSAPYYVMPLVEGETLQQRIGRETRLPLPDALRIAREILDALQYAHAHGVLHRDVKPANVMLSGAHAIVADFGLARLVDGTDLAVSDAGHITTTGIVVGSPAYMSPEQALGDVDIDERSDLFSFGCLFYEMLTGVTPFDAPTAQSMIARKVNGMFVPVHVMRPGIPEAVNDILRRALAPERSDRYTNAAECSHAIEELEQGSRSTPRASFSIPTPVRKRAQILALATTLIIGAILVASRSRGEVAKAQSAAAGPYGQTHIAVLPLEVPTPDSALAFLAEGLTSDLIDELARYPALMVISRNGVREYAHATLSPDSIARVLHVGSIITGDVQRVGDSVRVAVRLVDAASNAQIGKSEVISGAREFLRLRAAMIDSVTGVLRSTLGARIAQRERQAVANAEAWLMVTEVRRIIEGELSKAASWSAARRARRFSDVEQMLVKSAGLDTRWPATYVVASRLLLARADVEEIAAFTVSPDDDGRTTTTLQGTPEAFRRLGLRYAELALDRDGDDADAIFQRGHARMALLANASDSNAETLLTNAEADFRRAVALRRDMATAWSDLSRLLQFKGDFIGSAAAADSALKADAFLARAEEVVSRLAFVSLEIGRTDVAREWCARGKQRFPDDPRFWGCELTILGWTGNSRAQVDTAWRLLDAAERRDSLNILVTGWGTRRLLVAAVAARAGLGDSALAIVARVRGAQSSSAGGTQNDYGEAYVQVLLGHTDAAITLLTRYLAVQPSLRSGVGATSWFAPLHSDPRFVRLTAVR